MNPKSKMVLRSERGSALIASALISMMLLAGTVWYIQWSSNSLHESVHHSATQRAVKYAESGVDLAMATLRQPALLSPGDTTNFISTIEQNGQIQIQLQRSTTDPNIVTYKSYGYSIFPRGLYTTSDGQKAQRAEIEGKIKLQYVGDYFAAVPNELHISPGSTLTTGFVYAQDLIFDPGGGTTLGGAYYSDSCTPSETPPGVTFTTSPNQAQKLPSAPNLAYLDAATAAYYSERATILPAGTDLSNVVGPPSGNPYKVYYVDGDLSIGAAGPLVVQGLWVIYVTGSVHIHNNIVQNDPTITIPSNSDWVGILAQGSITIEADAPDNLNLIGNFLTNGALRAVAPTPARPAGSQLSFTGGFLAYEGANFTSAWPAPNLFRVYAHHTVADASFLLPSFTQLVEYRVTQGKYSR